MKQIIATITLSTLWISFSEFLRNQVLFNSYWEDHYHNLGLIFPTKPVNGVVWGIWSLVFAALIFILSTKFSLKQTIALSWTIGFVMMWLVIGNLGVLPYKLLIFAIPLSFVEVAGAAYICNYMSKRKTKE